MRVQSEVPAIQHAFRVTVSSSNGFVYPASHRAGNTAGAPIQHPQQDGEEQDRGRCGDAEETDPGAHVERSAPPLE